MSLNYDTLYGGDNDDILTTGAVPKGDSYVYYATIYGGGGNDSISVDPDFEANHYALYGEDGNDQITDHSYNSRDTLSGGAGDDTIFGQGQKQTVDGGDGYDKLDGRNFYLDPSRVSNIEELVIDTNGVNVGDFDLNSFQKITVAADEDSAGLTFTHAVDFNFTNIVTDGAYLNLTGSAETDRFDMSSYAGRFEVLGGGGNDTIIGNSASFYGDGGNGNDYIEGGSGNDRLSSGMLQEQTAYDTVIGGGGDDVIEFDAGGGTFDGGEGKDTFLIFPSNDHISLNKVSLKNIEILQFFDPTDVDLGSVDLTGVEVVGRGDFFMAADSVIDHLTIAKGGSLAVHGTATDDIASFAGSGGGVIFYGGDGNDRASTGGGIATLLGEGGNDTLSAGGDGKNHLDGGDGDDVLHGGDGRDHIDSGVGSDRINSGGGNDVIKLSVSLVGDVKTVNAGSGDDEIDAIHAVAAKGLGRIDGGDGNDVLVANGDFSTYRVKNVETLQLDGKLIASAATLNGFSTILAQHQLLPADEKFELQLSHGGTFTWHGSSTAEYGSLTGSGGKDILDFSAAGNEWLIHGGGGRDQIVGTEFSDSISGGDGADVINSGAGNDQDYGGAGNDRIDAGEGDDFIDGGDGNDILIAMQGINDLKGGSGGDTFVFGDSTRATIYDFDATGSDHDVIDLSQSQQISNFGHLMEHAKSFTEGTGVTLTFGSTHIEIEGASKGDLQPADFLF
jgi:Ca2+-binding RTX toxin-like protein